MLGIGMHATACCPCYVCHTAQLQAALQMVKRPPRALVQRPTRCQCCLTPQAMLPPLCR